MSAAQLSALRAVVPSAEPFQEGGRLLAFLPGLKVETQGGAVVCDALLHPQSVSGTRYNAVNESEVDTERF